MYDKISDNHLSFFIEDIKLIKINDSLVLKELMEIFHVGLNNFNEISGNKKYNPKNQK